MTIVFAPFLFLIICIEVATTINFPHGIVELPIVENVSDARNYALKPNARTYLYGKYEELPNPVLWQINQNGIRSDRSVESPKKKFRILTLGDSETFGWSVELEDTLQRQMEKIDSSVEVLNLGVPGYNVENVADYMEIAAKKYDPDTVIYAYNFNDVDPAFTLSPILTKSWSYILIRYLLYKMGGKSDDNWRASPEARKFLALQLERILEICKEVDVPLIIAVLRWDNPESFPFDWQESSYSSRYSTDDRLNAFYARVIDAQDIVVPSKRLDMHMTAPTYRELALRLCKTISGKAADACRPISSINVGSN